MKRMPGRQLDCGRVTLVLFRMRRDECSRRKEGVMRRVPKSTTHAWFGGDAFR
jgi:hypothetical protein